jgi:hypothetical protein
LFVKSQCLFNISHIFEVDCIWDLKTLHAVGMSPLLEMLLVSFSTPVGGTTADLAVEFFAKAM